MKKDELIFAGMVTGIIPFTIVYLLMQVIVWVMGL